MSTIISKAERKEAFIKVFGEVNGAATKRVSQENARQGETFKEMRVGKTAVDKRKGHRPYQKNIRVWQSGSTGKKGGGFSGQWVKANAA